MRKTRLASLLRISSVAVTAALATSACVTVNVNFPESAVQQATDDYVRDLYRARERGRGESGGTTQSIPAASPAPGKTSALPSLFASAWAAEEETFKVATEKSLAIREKLRTRVDEVIVQKRAGVLGEANDGSLVIREPGKLKALLAGKVQRLVAEENSDRKALYEEVVSANGLPPARLRNVQRSFARSFQGESPSGTWIQDDDGKWSQKP